jgi:hypothetical protein
VGREETLSEKTKKCSFVQVCAVEVSLFYYRSQTKFLEKGVDGYVSKKYVRDSHQNVSDFFLNVQKYWIFHFSFIG